MDTSLSSDFTAIPTPNALLNTQPSWRPGGSCADCSELCRSARAGVRRRAKRWSAPACVGDCSGDGTVGVAGADRRRAHQSGRRRRSARLRRPSTRRPTERCRIERAGAGGHRRAGGLSDDTDARARSTDRETAAPLADHHRRAERHRDPATATDTAGARAHGDPDAARSLPGHVAARTPLAVSRTPSCPTLITDEFAADLASRPPVRADLSNTTQRNRGVLRGLHRNAASTARSSAAVRFASPIRPPTTPAMAARCRSPPRSSSRPAASPTRPRDTASPSSFSGTCLIDDCTIHADGTWTRSDSSSAAEWARSRGLVPARRMGWRDASYASPGHKHRRDRQWGAATRAATTRHRHGGRWCPKIARYAATRAATPVLAARTPMLLEQDQPQHDGDDAHGVDERPEVARRVGRAADSMPARAR